MALTQIDDRGLKTPIDLLDNEKIRLGTGNDLEIYHDGSGNSILQDDNNLYIKGNSVYIQANQSESSAAFKYNGAVELYYNAVKKFETTSTGVDIHGNCTITGNFRGNDDIKLNLGSSDDLQIYHSSDNLIDSYGQNVKIRNRNTDGGVTENMITMSPNGAVGLFHDNIKTCQTDANGIQVLGPEGGDAYLKLYADEGDDNDDVWRLVASSAGNFHIQNASSGSYENNIVADGNGAVELYHDNVKKLETTSSGINIGCNLNTNLFDYLRFGASQFGAADIRPVNETNHKVGLAFYVDGTQDTTINPTEKVRIQAGGGISFNGDSAEANALNDYEYGAWTATASQGNVDSLSCRYQKIGHIVWVWGAVDDFTDRTGTSDIRITGLPFTVSENGYGTSIFYRVAFSDSTGEIGCLINTSEEVKFLVSSQGGSEAWFYLDYEDLNSSTSQIKFSGWYRTTQ